MFQRASLAEINLLRTAPLQYAETRLRDEFRAGTDNGAYRDIVHRSPVGALKLDRALCNAAHTYAQHLAVHDGWGHCEQGTPRQRCRHHGYHAYGGENVAAGTSPNLDADTDPIRAARLFVMRLTINAGVPDVAHRMNLLREPYRVVGIGFARNTLATYKNYTVHDFGLR